MLLFACSRAYVQKLEAENLQLRLQLATTQTQLQIAEAHACEDGPAAEAPPAMEQPSVATAQPSEVAEPSQSGGVEGGVVGGVNGGTQVHSEPPTTPPSGRGMGLVGGRPPTQEAGQTTDSSGTTSTPANTERNAAIAYREAMAQVDAGDASKAQAGLRAILEHYPATSAAQAAVLQMQELAVVGQPAPELKVDHWITGSGPATSTLTILAFWEVGCPHCQAEIGRAHV